MSLEPSRKRVCTEDRQVPQVERNVETKEAESKTQTLHWRVDTTGNIFYATSPNFQLPKERKGLRVAAFDLDHTLIVPRSGGVRPKNADDWIWFHDDVPKKLKTLHKNGCILLVFTNQSGAQDADKRSELLSKLDQVLLGLYPIPLAVFVCSGSGYLRKPSIGVWSEGLSLLGLSDECIDHTASFYVGDAGGRISGFKHTRDGKGFSPDFSDVDRVFAENINLHYMTPEEVFLGEDGPTKDQWEYTTPRFSVEDFGNDALPQPKGTQEVVMLVGPPASGKSTLFKLVFEPAGYVWINQDVLRTAARCVKKFTEAVAAKRSVVIDRQNVTVEQRANYISIAKAAGVPVRCIIVRTSLDLAQHLNKVRAITTRDAIPAIPDMVYHMFKKNYQEPTLEEGFSELVNYNWRPMFEHVQRLQGFENIEAIFRMRTSR